MQPLAIPSPVRWSIAILAAVVVAELLMPDRALGSCGDYVTIAPHGGVAIQAGEPGPKDAEPASAPLQTRDSPFALAPAAEMPSRPIEWAPCRRCPAHSGTPMRQPCHGPWCNGDRSPLSPPPSAPIEPAPEQAALSADSNRLRDAEHIALDFLRERVHRIHHVSPRYHPPRQA